MNGTVRKFSGGIIRSQIPGFPQMLKELKCCDTLEYSKLAVLLNSLPSKGGLGLFPVLFRNPNPTGICCRKQIRRTDAWISGNMVHFETDSHGSKSFETIWNAMFVNRCHVLSSAGQGRGLGWTSLDLPINPCAMHSGSARISA